MNKEQKSDVETIFDKWRNKGNLDYVSCWYKKAADFINGTDIRCALVSTNSITQGESVCTLWKYLFEDGIHIDFAYRTFRWDSESTSKAHVHCVIVGFSKTIKTFEHKIYSDGQVKTVENINAYLLPADNIFLENRKKPICDVLPLHYGSFALDDGNYTLEKDEYLSILEKDANCNLVIRPFIGAKEMLHNKKRYCVWLQGVSPSEINKHKWLKKKIKNVQEWRANSSRANTKALADTPALFAEIRQPVNPYLAIPTICSEKRRYIPIAFMSANIVASNQLYLLENASYYLNFPSINSGTIP